MKTITIELMRVVEGTSSNSEGFKLFNLISQEINQGNKIKISLTDSTPMSSSFMNSSFGELIEVFGMQKFKENVSLINFKPSQAESIKQYLSNLKSYC